MSVTRINIIVPKQLISELEKEVPGRGKSGFIREAIEEKLTRERREKALKELATLPPTFHKSKDGVDYIRKSRVGRGIT